MGGEGVGGGEREKPREGGRMLERGETWREVNAGEQLESRKERASKTGEST